MDERIFLLLLSDNTFVSLKRKGLSPICLTTYSLRFVGVSPIPFLFLNMRGGELLDCAHILFRSYYRLSFLPLKHRNETSAKPHIDSEIINITL